MISEVGQNSTTKATYTWSAEGTKLGVREPGLSGGGFEYLGSLIYKYVNGELQLESTSFSNGRIIASHGSSTTYTPNYFITDHLGSVRVMWDGSNTERSDYYPFGGRWTSAETQATTNRFLYNGKELQTTGGVKYLDYGARMYDSRIGRWHSIDPLAEKFISKSPFTYCDNNPIKYLDPNGEEKLIAFNVKHEDPDKKKANVHLDKVARLYKDDKAIYVFAHGEKGTIHTHINGEDKWITNADEFKAFLSANSETWQNRKEGDQITIILMSCNTGEGDNSIAQQISKEMPGVKIIAPSDILLGSLYEDDSEKGTFKTFRKGIRENGPARWRVFENGEGKTSYDGDWQPKENPSWWERLWNR